MYSWIRHIILKSRETSKPLFRFLHHDYTIGALEGGGGGRHVSFKMLSYPQSNNKNTPCLVAYNFLMSLSSICACRF